MRTYTIEEIRKKISDVFSRVGIIPDAVFFRVQQGEETLQRDAVVELRAITKALTPTLVDVLDRLDALEATKTVAPNAGTFIPPTFERRRIYSREELRDLIKTVFGVMPGVAIAATSHANDPVGCLRFESCDTTFRVGETLIVDRVDVDGVVCANDDVGRFVERMIKQTAAIQSERPRQ